ncbi:phosphomethylpyrimidine kinase [Bifidobacterium reuteri DSM 23975]|uniref:Phosphomethylpyrimidine kinase n=1 Tax=Bifidobacterium reuteri DSM 23975 TaxID=1437610 RepID=A0A087CP00_9BIFI|nr:bifunctional hydroxymethylpyrimidine kinase/phosphomethylpyrimidine kinase [Bifidobacterium reuteri]KFI85000.1 phosphomethylpyrimidine kinase [Bifidobacterium reuteri DSM 23975]
MSTTLPAVLAISGSDSSGGAGMQADLKTMLACGVFGMSAITALTAQNTTRVRSIQDTKPEILADQIDMVFEDIPPVAVKIGMVSSADIINVIADRLTAHHATNIVLDPVMVATSGAKLISDDAIAALTSRLFGMATVVTPNIPEAEALTDTLIHDQEDMETAARRISEQYGCAALVKGGHGTEDANDVLAETDGTVTWFDGMRIDNPNTHGTGCTLSSAIAAYLAQGEPLPKAIKHAKKYLTGALKAQLDLGHGSGPMDHFWKYR